MPRRLIKRFGSLHRRLEQADLAFLSVTRRPVQSTRLPLTDHQTRPVKSFLTRVLPVMICGMVVLLASSGALRLLIPSTHLTHLPASPAGAPVVHRKLVGLATAENIEDLAQILMAEASPGVANEHESSAVGYTVLNRMQASGTRSVRDVWDAYAHEATPTDETRTLASRLLHGEHPDHSRGATHFYSPRSMPMEDDSIRGFDTSGGLEQTPGISKKNYRPGWATQYEMVVIAGTRSSHYKFYRQPDMAFHK